MPGSPAFAVARQGTRYLAVGLVAYAVDFGLFTVCVQPWGMIAAQAVARVGGAVVGFAGHKWFAFGDARRSPRALLVQLAGYAALWVCSYVASTVAMMLLVERIGCSPLIAKLAVEPAIVLFNFVVMRRSVFAVREGVGP
jgi:putative flippase GtrA